MRKQRAGIETDTTGILSSAILIFFILSIPAPAVCDPATDAHNAEILIELKSIRQKIDDYNTAMREYIAETGVEIRVLKESKDKTEIRVDEINVEVEEVKKKSSSCG